jgi:hypothetical protein
MSKVIVGINIDDTVKLPNKGSIDVEVTSIKALDLDNMELVDIGIDNCKDVIGIKVDKDFDNTFTISVGRKGTRVHASSDSLTDYRGALYVAVFKDNDLLAGGDSSIYLEFERSIRIRYNLSNSTYTIRYNTNYLYDCYETDNVKIGYEDIEIYRNLYDTSIDSVGIFNKINDYEYNLFDIAYIITELHSDVIVSNGIKILGIDLDKVYGEYNVVIPPSVEAVYFSNEVTRYSKFWENADNDIVTFNVAKSKRDGIVSFMANELKFKGNSHLDNDKVLDLYDLKVVYY